LETISLVYEEHMLTSGYLKLTDTQTCGAAGMGSYSCCTVGFVVSKPVAILDTTSINIGSYMEKLGWH
jgi:hypothetical protein